MNEKERELMERLKCSPIWFTQLGRFKRHMLLRAVAFATWRKLRYKNNPLIMVMRLFRHYWLHEFDG